MKHLILTDRQAAVLKPTLERAKKAALSFVEAGGLDTATPHEVMNALKYLTIAEEYQIILTKLNGGTNE